MRSYENLKIYETVENIIHHRRQGASLAEVFESLLRYPRVWQERGLETPFGILSGLNESDMLDMSTPTWVGLSVDKQILYASHYQLWYARQLRLPVEIDSPLNDSVGIKMRFIPPGKFVMGSPESERGRYNDEAQRIVVIERPFWCGKHEVAQAVWESVMGENPSEHKGEKKPVINVSWNDCQEFCKQTETALLTEEQWEYACRAGTTTTYNFGDSADNLGEYAVLGRSSGSGPLTVGRKKPNSWGLHDMHGNVWEWTASLCYPASSYRVFRGGSWNSSADGCRSANRFWFVPTDRGRFLGLRVSRFV